MNIHAHPSQVNELLSEARAQVHGAALAALDAEVAQLRKALALMKPHDVRACDMAPGFVRELGLDPQVRTERSWQAVWK